MIESDRYFRKMEYTALYAHEWDTISILLYLLHST